MHGVFTKTHCTNSVLLYSKLILELSGVLCNVQKQIKKLINRWKPPTQTELENMKKWWVYA
jgi:hypothetical protein